MSRRSKTLFHTCISPLLNLHRLLPARVVADAAAHEAAPIASREGFVRQVLGWREFMHHVHEETGGLRRLPEASPGARRSGGAQPCAEAPGDGGYRRWRAGQGEAVSPAPGAGTGRGTTGLGGSAASFLGAADPVPPAYWGQSSGLACLDHVVSEVWADGWTHHINRLMVLSNLATLLDLSPRELADWFWVGFVDAFDWVVEPNVMGMGTFGLGALFVTKPYVSGAAYLDRMSDYCGACTFRPKQNCPITSLYWAFLERHQDRLAGNPRMAMPLRSLEKRGETRRAADRDIAARVRRGLAEGKRLTPALLGEPSTP